MACEDNAPGTLRHSCRDGRACRLCGARDSTPDEIVPSELLYWGDAPRNNKPGGNYCLYCLRVFERRYKVSHKTIKSLVRACGESHTLMDEVRGWRSKLVDLIRENGNNRSARLSWARLEQERERVIAEQSYETRLEEPDEHWVPEPDYIKAWGDPDKNGKGHQRGIIPGTSIRGVRMTSMPVYKVKRARVNAARKQSIVADSTEPQLGSDNVKNTFEAFAQGVFGDSRAFGEAMSLSDICSAMRKPSGAEPVSTSGPVSSHAASPASCSKADRKAADDDEDDDTEPEGPLWPPHPHTCHGHAHSDARAFTHTHWQSHAQRLWAWLWSWSKGMAWREVRAPLWAGEGGGEISVIVVISLCWARVRQAGERGVVWCAHRWAPGFRFFSLDSQAPPLTTPELSSLVEAASKLKRGGLAKAKASGSSRSGRTGGHSLRAPPRPSLEAKPASSASAIVLAERIESPSAPRPAAGGGKGARGAPSRNLVEVTCRRLAEWADTDEKSDFYNELKAHVRNAYRLEKDLEAKLQKLTSENEEYHAHKVACKCMHVLHSTLLCLQSNGAYSQKLTKVMDDGEHFLALEPHSISDDIPFRFQRGTLAHAH